MNIKIDYQRQEVSTIPHLKHSILTGKQLKQIQLELLKRYPPVINPVLPKEEQEILNKLRGAEE